MRWESDDITNLLSQVVVSEGNSRARADSFASSSKDIDLVERKLPPDRLLAVQKDAGKTFDVIVERLTKQQATEAGKAPAS